MQLFANCWRKLETTDEGGEACSTARWCCSAATWATPAATTTRTCRSLFAGGGFKHGQHLAFDPKKNPPLCNLYVQMLQRLGAEVDEFGSSTGRIPGFELA